MKRHAIYTPPMHSKELNKRMAKAMPESDLATNVISAAHAFGWMVAHFRSVRVTRNDGSTYWQTPVAADGEGFPDLCMVNPRLQRIMFIETKTEKNVVEPRQKEWLAALEATGKVEQGIWRPTDWLSGEIERRLR